MDLHQIGEIERNLERVVVDLNPELKKKLKEQFTQFFSIMLYNELELKLVIDANIVISAGISKTKKGRDLEILSSPHLKMFAPSEIKKEIEEHLEEVAEKKKIDIIELRNNINHILEKITILNPDERDLEIAIKMTEMRDTKDAPYIGLIFTTKSHGVMTHNEKHFSGLSGVEIINEGETGKILTNFELGTFSFFILGTSASVVGNFSKFIFKTFSSVFATILEVIKNIFEVIINGISKGIEGLSKLGWIAIIIIIAVGITLKEKITETLKELGGKVNQFFQFISESFKDLFNFLKEIFTIAMDFFCSLIGNVQKSIEFSYELESQLKKNNF